MLVILGARSADTAVSEAFAIRKLWPDCKIILLFEDASAADFQQLLAAQIDGCISLSVSTEKLIAALDLIVVKDVRVILVGDTTRLSIPPTQEEESHQAASALDRLQSGGVEHEGASVAMSIVQHTGPTANGTSTADLMSSGDTQPVHPLPNLPRLSEREAQILDDLVKGHANKVIARRCAITEATVKVHMKSILRKIRVLNRTQAAIWAFENGYAADETKAAR